MKSDSDPNQDTAFTQPSPQPKTLTASRIILAIVFVGACALAGIDFLAKAKWKAAVEVANKLYDEDNNDPKEYMEEIGSTPRVTVSPGGLIQIYRWTGSLRTYDLRLSFHGDDGAYVLSELDPVYHPADLSKMQLAKATGTLDDKLAENSSPDETNPMSTMGSGGGGGQEGDGPGGGRRGGINPDDLGLNEEQKAKWEKATEKRRAEMRSMFPGGGRGDGGTDRGGSSRDFYVQLDLTEDQQAKIEAIQQTQSTERRKMLEELRSNGGDREANRAKFTELREKFDKQTQAVLTDAQKMKLMEMQAQRGQAGNRTGGQPGGVSERFAKVRESFEKNVQAFLTEEQFKKYKDLSTQSRGRRGGGGSGGAGPSRGGADGGGRGGATDTSPEKPKGNSGPPGTSESRDN
ncbi:MAG: hypothetical protein QF685_01810 [Verrucomicrobiota bacterium]|jgi:Spy/CpxP family protein refolding chaperone|nr:hypothetical protein [Verrucomicrobiota bacterium]